jgi:hypothetical protein
VSGNGRTGWSEIREGQTITDRINELAAPPRQEPAEPVLDEQDVADRVVDLAHPSVFDVSRRRCRSTSARGGRRLI